jgi:hypothetical protein
MKTYGGVEVRIAPPFLTSALDGGEWSASRPYRFNQEDRTTGPHWIEACAGPRAGLDAMKMRKEFLTHAGNRTPVVQSMGLSLYQHS